MNDNKLKDLIKNAAIADETIPADELERAAYKLRCAMIQRIKDELKLLYKEERKEIFDEWCTACGGNLPCYCWNDE